MIRPDRTVIGADICLTVVIGKERDAQGRDKRDARIWSQWMLLCDESIYAYRHTSAGASSNEEAPDIIPYEHLMLDDGNVDYPQNDMVLPLIVIEAPVEDARRIVESQNDVAIVGVPQASVAFFIVNSGAVKTPNNELTPAEKALRPIFGKHATFHRIEAPRAAALASFDLHGGASAAGVRAALIGEPDAAAAAFAAAAARERYVMPPDVLDTLWTQTIAFLRRRPEMQTRPEHQWQTTRVIRNAIQSILDEAKNLAAAAPIASVSQPQATPRRRVL